METTINFGRDKKLYRADVFSETSSREKRNKTSDIQTGLQAISFQSRSLKSIYLRLQLQLFLSLSHSLALKTNVLKEKLARCTELKNCSMKTNHPTINIPEKALLQLSQALDSWEEKKGFLTKSTNLTNLARTLGTNHGYLSKFINVVKGKNFPTYLSDLRIEFIQEHVLSNPLFRKYTIQAIAEEAGFKNPENFAKKFKQRYGMNPSEYIKQLD